MADPALQSVMLNAINPASAPGVMPPALPDDGPDTELPGENDKVMEREHPDPAPERRAAVNAWQSKVVKAREIWEKVGFKRMRENMRMVRGDQWGSAADPNRVVPALDIFNDDPGGRYVANVILRHIQNRTAAIYGKNPKFVARRAKRLLSAVWDGTFQQLTQAVQTLTQASTDTTGNPNVIAAAVEANQIIQDAQQTLQQNKQLDKIAETLELLFEHELNEQPVPFKVQMKGVVRRALTTSVGYTKVGYKRVMAMRPEEEQRVADLSQQLAALRRVSADIADGELPPDSPEADQLNLLIADLQKSGQTVVSEGLTFSFPHSTAIIPDPQVQSLRGFMGADWVAEEFLLTRSRIKEVYGIDVGTGESSARAYTDQSGRAVRGDETTGKDVDWETKFCVWEIYCKVDGLVYVVCDGYPEYLAEPSSPDVWLERFYPWFAFLTNEIYDEGSALPPSDVDLLRDMQLEINRARQGLREHRRAARPKTVARAGTLEDADKTKLSTGKAHELVELKGLPDNMRVEDALVAWSGPKIEPGLYETDAAYQDILRVVGDQEANLGGTSGATATETSIAEGSRMSSITSVIDDLDEFLTEIARACGQILLKNTSAETVKQIVGPGAVWPDLTKDQIAKEIFLDIEAASTGRPNKAQEIQNATQMLPLLLQIPGLSPEWLAREMLRRLDDRVDLSDAFASGMPSIAALNSTKQVAGPGGQDPNQQGDKGAQNTPSTEPPQTNVAPRAPEPQQQVNG